MELIGLAGSRSIAQRLRNKYAYTLDMRFSTEAWLTRSVVLDSEVAPARRQIARVRPPRHLLVPTVGMGNIGDQAMLESFLLNTRWPVTLVVEHEHGHNIPPGLRARVRKVVIPDLFATRPWTRRKIRKRLLALIAAHSTLSLIGADVMDGGYSTAQSTIRCGLLCIGNSVGTPSRVLGFSWNGAPPESVHFALDLSQPRAMLCSRDPHSLARLRSEGNYNVVQTADVVFAMNVLQPYGRITSWISRQHDRNIVIMNVSGMLARNATRTAEYVEVAKHLLHRGCSIILLPHVIREGDDDLAACAATINEIGLSLHVYLVEELLAPSQVAWLTRHASAVLTGRMHLSILSLNQGVPAAVLSTQGKVSGLMELFESPRLVLEPDNGFAANAIKAIDMILDDPSVTRRILERLPYVRELSSRNFAGLEEEKWG